jgi:hypothetical protein
MNNPWKLATLGLVVVMITALSTGLTTAYMMRPATTGSAEGTVPVVSAPAVAAPPAYSAATPRVATAAPRVTTARTPAPVVRPASITPVAVDCATGGERAMKIAKPGLVGTLAGAGLGAIGGAIADGGSGAGKGALIGGLAGAALGGGYGAYKTKQECGTIFGNTGLGSF